MTEHWGDWLEEPGWDAIAAREATEGWTQEIIPSAAVQQVQLDVDCERDPWHEMTGPGYTEPPLDWYPDPDPAVEAARDAAQSRLISAWAELETDSERFAAYQEIMGAPECDADADAEAKPF